MVFGQYGVMFKNTTGGQRIPFFGQNRVKKNCGLRRSFSVTKEQTSVLENTDASSRIPSHWYGNLSLDNGQASPEFGQIQCKIPIFVQDVILVAE